MTSKAKTAVSPVIKQKALTCLLQHASKYGLSRKDVANVLGYNEVYTYQIEKKLKGHEIFTQHEVIEARERVIKLAKGNKIGDMDKPPQGQTVLNANRQIIDTHCNGGNSADHYRPPQQVGVTINMSDFKGVAPELIVKGDRFDDRPPEKKADPTRLVRMHEQEDEGGYVCLEN